HEGPADDQPDKKVTKFSPGLTYADAQAIAHVVPGVEVTSAEVVLNTSLTREGLRRSGKLVGVDTTYFRLTNLALATGTTFTPLQVERGLPVAIIGHGVRTRFFTTEDPVRRPLKVRQTWVTLLGLLQARRLTHLPAQPLGIHDPNRTVYGPA